MEQRTDHDWTPVQDEGLIRHATDATVYNRNDWFADITIELEKRKTDE